MMNEKTALAILAIVSIFAAGGLFVLQDTSTTGDAAAYYFLTSGDAQTGPPNKMVDVRGEVPLICQKPADCPEGYDCKRVRVDAQYLGYTQPEYQRRCVALNV